MRKTVSIAIVGDFDPKNRSHPATTEAVEHCGAAIGLHAEPDWIGTEEMVEPGSTERLTGFDGVWVAPASPYKSMEGALRAIRIARESRIPLLGTCGGFQHIVLEYARSVLGFAGADHEETNPSASQLFLSRLSCSLVGRTMNIALKPDSLLARLYGRTAVREKYHCNFGVNSKYVDVLRSSALRIVASDHEGEVRAVELAEHPFFVGTLFLPQHISTAKDPHPLICGFVRACRPAD